MIETERLILRAFKESDATPFAALNADPVVMEHFPALLTREESDAAIGRINAGIEKNGFGFWAAEVKETGQFIGFIGIKEIVFMPGYEIGWRLTPSAWGKGYATEGARRSVQYGFETLKLDEILSFARAENMRSRRVMERLGMRHDPSGDFDHPNVPDGPKRRHVLYRLANAS